MDSAPSIWFVNQHYWPDVASTGQHLTDLAEHLAGEGFHTSVLCSTAGYRGGLLNEAPCETRNGVRIRRLRVPGFGRGRLLGRATDYCVFHADAARAVWSLSAERPPDLVVSLTTPSLLPVTMRAVCAKRRIKYGIWAMDLHPDVESTLRLLPAAPLLSRPLSAASAWAYRGADFVVAIGPTMADRIVATRQVAPKQVLHIPVWSDRTEVHPIPVRQNTLRRDLGYEDDDLVVMYSGNAGLAHDFKAVVDAMDRLRGEEKIHFLFIGGGPRRREIEDAALRLGLPRFRYLEYFPRSKLAQSLSIGDVHLLVLRRDMAGLVAPSKLYGSMAAGRPTIMVGPAASDPALLIRGENVGVVIDPQAASSPGALLADNIERLCSDSRTRRMLGERARTAFIDRYERSTACAAWTQIIEKTLECSGRSRLPREMVPFPREGSAPQDRVDELGMDSPTALRHVD